MPNSGAPVSNLTLRPYQKECLARISEYYEKGVRRQLVSAATGSGKTVIFAHLIRNKQYRSLVLVHTNELLQQACDKIKMICPSLEVGVINAAHKEFDKPVVVASIQAARQPETLKQLQKQNFTLIIADECHRFGADSPRMIIDALGFSKDKIGEKLLVGFSATPFRTDNKGLGEVFDAIVYEKGIKELVNDGYLCAPRGIRVVNDLDFSKVSTDDGDYSATSLAKIMDTDQLNQLVAKTYIDRGEGRKAICFGVSIAHAINLAHSFKTYGVTSKAVHGNMSIEEREGILNSFKNGEISVLTNCQILTEGFDCPQIESVIVARPTQSPALYQQMVGRGLRLFPNKKDCLILDFGDKNHSLCTIATLVADAEEEEKAKPNEKMVSLAHALPPTINQKLRSAILEYNPLGDSFSWQREGMSYCLKATGNKLLKIIPSGEDRYSVVLLTENTLHTIASDLSFEYAFASAEDFANANRSLFIVSDLDAAWRQLPLSDKQRALIKSYGYRNGIEDLSRGQAATIISSGVLMKKTTKNSYKRK